MLTTDTMRHRHKAKPAALEAVPTPERLLKAAGAVVYGDDKRGRRITTIRDAPLERALDRGAVSRKQYEAGCKYRLHWNRAGLQPRYATIDPNRVLGAHGAGLLENEAAAFHHARYREAVQAVGEKDGWVLDWIVCLERPLEDAGTRLLGWDTRGSAIVAAMERLRAALDVLCRLWGL